MRKSVAIVIVVVALVTAIPSFAELQNVLVGGSVRVRGNWWISDDDNLAFVEQRTRLNVRADFTDAVSAFIEVDSWDAWGDDFRSNYLTGVDGRAVTNDDVEIYQGYIEANEMWGQPLRARIGRQEIKLGSGWLVGTNDKNALFTGLSFDAVRLTYATDQVSVDALWAKLAETSPAQEDGDADLYGVYASYLGIENVSLDAYWLFMRDAANWKGSLDLHTFGLRGAGTVGAFDFEAEAAYQIGNLDDQRRFFNRDDDYDWEAWGVNAEVGYTFDMNYTPRVFLGGAWLEGSDEEDLAFDRLYSNWEYSLFLDNMGNMTGLWLARAGVSAMPTESVKVSLAGAYLSCDNDDEDHCWLRDNNDDDEIGWEVDASVLYNYTEDLAFEVGYAHFFDGDDEDRGIEDDMDYVYFETKLAF